VATGLGQANQGSTEPILAQLGLHFFVWVQKSKEVSGLGGPPGLRTETRAKARIELRPTKSTVA
jgi:hypothetical protein